MSNIETPLCNCKASARDGQHMMWCSIYGAARSARPEGDGLQSLIDLVSRSRSHEIDLELREKIIEGLLDISTSPDAAEGAGETYGEALAKLNTRFAFQPHTAAPPKPPPDAVRALGAARPYVLKRLLETKEDFERNVLAQIDAALAAPVPPADGAAPNYEAAALALGFTRLPTGNWAHPHDGQHMDMTRFYPSAEAIFNQEIPDLLSPSGTGAAEPVAWRRVRNDGAVTYWETAVPDSVPLYTTPPVRGDREAIARAIYDLNPSMSSTQFSGPEPTHWCYDTRQKRLAYKQADAILSLPIPPGAVEQP